MLRLDEADGLEVAAARWGLIPFWWKDAKPPKNTFNARSEEVATKPYVEAPGCQGALSGACLGLV